MQQTKTEKYTFYKNFTFYCINKNNKDMKRKITFDSLYFQKIVIIY